MLLLNTILSAKKRTIKNEKNVGVDETTLKKYVTTLQKMLQCKTVYNTEKYDDTEFAKFREVVKEEFPLLNEKAELMIFGTGCFVYKLTGKDKNTNIMLMSHHDVVEVGKNWQCDPFKAEIIDGKIYARGAIDTKTPLFGELQAAEELLEEKYELPCNIYVASSNNEEVCGDGIVKAVEYFKENGIKFDFLIDEGGAIVEKTMPGVNGYIAMIAVHEKGRHTFKCVAEKDEKKDGGHSGLTCKSDNPITRMSMFIAEIERLKRRTKLYPEVRATFGAVAPYMSFGYRFLFANLRFFEKPLLKIMPRINGQIGAMLQNTVSFTKIEGKGKYDMVQPKRVEATALYRCVRQEDLYEELKIFKQIAAKFGIFVEADIVDFCKPASFTNEKYKLIEKTINQNFPSVITAPYLLTAGSDARRFTEIAENIYRFAPLTLSSEQFKTIHSDNENISVKNIGEVVCFYKQLIKNYEVKDVR